MVLFSCFCCVNIEQVFDRQENDLCKLFFYPCFSILGNDKQGIGFFGVEAFVSDMIAVFADEEFQSVLRRRDVLFWVLLDLVPRFIVGLYCFGEHSSMTTI